MSHYARKDNFWIVLVATLLLIFSTIPNWVGYRVQTDELSYKGIFFDSQDYAVHISMLRAGMQGDWAYQFRFTTEPHRAAYIRLFYIVLGQINRLFQFDPALFFEIARWIFGYLAIFAIYSLAKRVIRETQWQRVAILLAVFGSGLGWLQLIYGWLPGPITPIDFWLIDAYVFFSIALFPHFSFVTASLCFVFIMYLDYLDKGNWKYIFGIASVSIVTQFVNPIAFILVDLALVVVSLMIWIQKQKIVWQQFAALGIIAIAQLPLLIYNFNLLTNDPVWSQFTRQNKTLSPPPLYYLWGFGFLWVFALAGLVFALHKRKPALLGLTAWIVTGLLLAYAPFAIQRRFLHGATIPLGFLAAYGLAQLTQIFSQRFHWLTRRNISIVIIVVSFASISSLYLIVGRSLYLLGHPTELYYPTTINPALTWLQKHASPNDFVLSAAPSGLLIAQKTNLRAYLGHEMETLNHDSKTQLVEAYFQGKTDPDWLKMTSVSWVLYGPYERDLAAGHIFQGENMQVAFRSQDVLIYRVNK